MIFAKATSKLLWDANTESDLAGYRVYFGTESGQYGLPKDVGNVTEVTLVSLGIVADGNYFLALTAYDMANNVSGFSVELPLVLDTIAPVTPGGLRIVG